MLTQILKQILSDVLAYLDLQIQKSRWRLQNKHNFTTIVKKTDLKKVKVGDYSYGNLEIYDFGNSKEFLEIGNFVSIANNVIFILGGNHQISTVTTYPINAKLIKKNFEQDALTKGPIIIDDEVWIGNNVLVLSGVRLGKGSIVAAGSIVTKNVEPYTIVGGNPAIKIKDRFPQKIKESLFEFSLHNFHTDEIISQVEKLYKPIGDDCDVINQLKSKVK